MSDSAPRILHCDMDCFYAAVHVRDDPSLEGQPVVVGGDPNGRGVVAAANYEARRYGIHSALPAARAKRLCRHTVFLKPDFKRYKAESTEIFAIYHDFTPTVQPMSLDEAYLDVTEHLGSFGSGTAVAQEIRRRVRDERGLTVSVGVAANKLVAKIASDFDKPDGVTVVKPSEVEAFLAPLPVRRLHGIGPATEGSLAKLEIHTVADLRAISLDQLLARFGHWGRWLWKAARGIDDRPVRTESIRKSLSTERTFADDIRELSTMDEILVEMSEEVASGLRRRELTASTVTVKARYPDFTTVTRSKSFPTPVVAASSIAEYARHLLRRTEAPRRAVRLLGVGASNLVHGNIEQLDLFGSEMADPDPAPSPSENTGKEPL